MSLANLNSVVKVLKSYTIPDTNLTDGVVQNLTSFIVPANSTVIVQGILDCGSAGTPTQYQYGFSGVNNNFNIPTLIYTQNTSSTSFTGNVLNIFTNNTSNPQTYYLNAEFAFTGGITGIGGVLNVLQLS